ncbi:MAG TPA: P-loop NTPase [Ktedonobacteraceae bacterium]|nr:P-loop NTPase [Ktedonobacteraceae bacterium]
MQQKRTQTSVENVQHLIVIGSGKGGVGKSTVSVNLAVALAQQGAAVGLLDADTYGPSVPLMLGVRKRGETHGWRGTLPFAQRQKLAPEQMLQPLLRYGVKVMSVGFFVGEEQAVAPMPDVQGMLIRQLLYMVNWGPLDYLLIDLPPGNGEPQATLVREMALSGAILVTTPQDVARIDTAKALAMFRQARVHVLGLVTNMSGFSCPHCGELIEIFPASQERRGSLDELPTLSTIPLHPPTAATGDNGRPVTVSLPTSSVALAFHTLASNVARALDEIEQARDAEQQAATDEASSIKDRNSDAEAFAKDSDSDEEES